MAKGSGDLILRDRLQFTMTTGGDQSLVYGRLDLSDYVNVVERKGLSIKEIRLQPRVPAPDTGSWNDTGVLNTGAFFPWAYEKLPNAPVVAEADLGRWSALKIVATTRAYEDMNTIGIASPDVYHCEEWTSMITYTLFTGEIAAGAGAGLAGVSYAHDHKTYGTPDLHPNGATIVSDLLIGVAADNWVFNNGAETLEAVEFELDVMVIADPVTVTQKAMNELLVQQQDL